MNEAAQHTDLPATTVAQSTDLSPFGSASGFETGQRMAKALAASSLVPKAYQGNVADCMIAIEMAGRLNISPLSVLQNLDVIHGRPSFRAKMMIAAFNSSPDFGSIRYEWKHNGQGDKFGCRAYALDKASGENVHGPWITIEMAKAEGWYQKQGSKWKTMPEKMLMYRAGAWFVDTYAPELMLAAPEIGGEIIDVEPIVITDPKNALSQAMGEAARRREAGEELGPVVLQEDEASGSPGEPAGPSYAELTAKLEKAATPEDVYFVMSCADALDDEESSKLLQSCKAKQLQLEAGEDG